MSLMSPITENSRVAELTNNMDSLSPSNTRKYQKILSFTPAIKSGKGEELVVKVEGKRESTLLPFLKCIALDKSPRSHVCMQIET
jgi:hypothetical protein